MLIDRPDLVVWDWDGTLVDSGPVIYAAHNHVRVSMGHPAWSEEEFKDISYYSTDEIYPQLYGERVDEAKSMLYRFFDDRNPGDTAFIDGGSSVLSFFSEHGVPMVVVSNKQDHVLAHEIAVAPFKSALNGFVGAGKAKKDKPHVDPFLLAIENSGLGGEVFSNIWFVGDTQTDVDCAKNLPFKTVSIIIGNEKTKGEDVRFASLFKLFENVKNVFASD